jgi:hypothetical protein
MSICRSTSAALDRDAQTAARSCVTRRDDTGPNSASAPPQKCRSDAGADRDDRGGLHFVNSRGCAPRRRRARAAGQQFVIDAGDRIAEGRPGRGACGPQRASFARPSQWQAAPAPADVCPGRSSGSAGETSARVCAHRRARHAHSSLVMMGSGVRVPPSASRDCLKMQVSPPARACAAPAPGRPRRHAHGARRSRGR